MIRFALLRMVVLLTTLLSSVGCAVSQRTLSGEDLASVKKIGIMVLHGESLEANFVGFTMFNNGHWTSESTGWDFRPTTEMALKKSLSLSGYDVVEVEYPFEVLWDRYKESYKSYTVRVNQSYGGDIYTSLFSKEISSLVSNYELDGVLIAMPGYEAPYCSDGEPCIGYGSEGYGIHNRLESRNEVYMSLNLLFYSLNGDQTIQLKGGTYANLHQQLTFKDWHSNEYAYSSEEKKEILAAIDVIANKEFPIALMRLGF